MSEELRVVHSGVEIKYVEHENQWKVDDAEIGITLRRGSLEEAKKAVDAKLRNAGKGKFKRFEAWKLDGYGSGRYFKVTVTSKVEESYRTSSQYWVSWKRIRKSYNGRHQYNESKREKVDAMNLFPTNATNDRKIARITELRKQIDVLSDRMNKITPQSYADREDAAYRRKVARDRKRNE